MAIETKDLYPFLSKYRIPYDVHFELTNKCNIDCIHCYIHETQLEPNKCRFTVCKECNYSEYCDTSTNEIKELYTHEVIDILKQIVEMGTVNIIFTGGEVFLRKDIFHIIEFACKQGFRVSILTNGTLLDKKTCLKLGEINKKYQKLRIKFSIYGHNSKIHDSITRKKGSFEKTVNSIQLLNKYGIHTAIQVMWMRKNFKFFKDILKFVYTLSQDINTSAYLSPTVSGSESPVNLRLTDAQLKEYIKYKMEVDPPEKKLRLPPPEAGMCAASTRMATITSTGDVIPCLSLRLRAGNLRKYSFKEIWENAPLFKFLRTLKPTDFDCYFCEDKLYCIFHRCPGRAFLEKGDLFRGDYEACRFTKIFKGLIQGTPLQNKINEIEIGGDGNDL